MTDDKRREAIKRLLEGRDDRDLTGLLLIACASTFLLGFIAGVTLTTWIWS